MNILMVCLGNICRSPLAEGILEHKSKEYNKNVKVDSAGTGKWHIGEMPDKRSIAIAKKYGIDISDQRARHFSMIDFDIFDVIYVMDKSNYQDVIALAPNEEAKNKVKLILGELYPNEKKEVPDPYWGGEKEFDTVYQLLNDTCNIIIQKI